MLDEAQKALIRQSMRALRDGIEGFRSRRAQLEMIATVARALARKREADSLPHGGQHLAVIEAGTGTGKSFGALVPALVIARATGKRLVVSSSTVALQHQYAEKDVPTLQKLLPFQFTAAVAKGRTRYACPAKLYGEAQAAGQGDLALAQEDAARRAARVADERRLRELADTLASARWSGERDELAEPVNNALWERITSDRHGCAGARCPHFATCPYQQARERVREADLVIANHDLVLATLELEGQGVLPAPADTLYVFDEAHSLPVKAVEHLSAGHSLAGTVQWLEGARDAMRDAVQALRLDPQLLAGSQGGFERIEGALFSLLRQIRACGGFDERSARRFKSGALPSWCQSAGAQILRSAQALASRFASLREQALKRAESASELAAHVVAVLGFYAGRIDQLIATWELMLTESPKGSAANPVARWVEQHKTAAGEAGDFWIHAAPLSAAAELRRRLWERAGAAVLMSATLSSCGRFDLFLRQSGLDGYPQIFLLQVDSPFDYRANAQLIVPAMASEPDAGQAYTRELIKRLPALLDEPGTLVLFTSAQQMRAVHAGLPEALAADVLMQGAMPKGELLTRHRAAVDAGKRSIVFGLASFAEGIDLPGAYCTHVILARLPFSVPDSPLEEARREWVEARGGSAFLELSVPEASVRFKQALGRLLRTVEDRGRVTLLDRRIVSRRWGALLLRGIPDFEVVIEPAARRPVKKPPRQEIGRPS